MMLAACGFTPLYAEPGVSPTLSRIAVTTPDNRLGYELRQQLEDALAWDRGQTPLWRLANRRGAASRRPGPSDRRHSLAL